MSLIEGCAIRTGVSVTPVTLRKALAIYLKKNIIAIEAPEPVSSMTQINVNEVLERSPLFAGFEKGVVAEFSSGASVVRFDKGQMVFARGEIADAAYVVLAGVVSIEILSPEGRMAQFAAMSAGDLFGELAIIDGGERTADARARSASTLLRVSKKQFEKAILQNPELAIRLFRDVVKKLRGSNQQIECVHFQTLRTRLAGLLHKLWHEHANDTGVIIHITQSELADRLSATREKVNVHLQAFKDAGAISIGRGKLEIIDQAMLADLAEEA